MNAKWSFISAPWDSCLYSSSVFHHCLFFQPPWSEARNCSLQCEYAGYIAVWSSSLHVSVSLWAAYLSNHFYSSKLYTQFLNKLCRPQIVWWIFHHLITFKEHKDWHLYANIKKPTNVYWPQPIMWKYLNYRLKKIVCAPFCNGKIRRFESLCKIIQHM